MENCKQCGKELTHVPGRKQKMFCDVNCRNKWFYASRNKLIELARLGLEPLKDIPGFEDITKVGILNSKGEVSHVRRVPQSKPLPDVKDEKEGKGKGKKEKTSGGAENKSQGKRWIAGDKTPEELAQMKELQREKMEGAGLEFPSNKNDATGIPKNLAELKLMCPKELVGFERSEWVSKNRLKYNI